jgi:hypothetical protein
MEAQEGHKFHTTTMAALASARSSGEGITPIVADNTS